MPPGKPITIIGGGLAGLTLGIGLRQREVPVKIFEAGIYPRHRVCGEFISGNGQAVLERLGLLARLEQAGAVHARTVMFVCGSNRSPVRQLAAPALCLSRHAMDALLAGSFQQLGGELLVNTRWTSGESREGVVHASGRRARAAEKNPRWFGVKAHVSRSSSVKLEADLEMHLSPDGYIGVNRINGGEVNVCGLFRVREGARRPESRQDWLRGETGSLLRERLGAAEFDAGLVLLRGRVAIEAAARGGKNRMLHRRRLDDDPASHRQRHVHGLRVGGDGRRTTGRLQRRQIELATSPAANRPALRCGLFTAAGLGAAVAMDDDFARADRLAGRDAAAIRPALAADVCADAVVSGKMSRAIKNKIFGSN